MRLKPSRNPIICVLSACLFATVAGAQAEGLGLELLGVRGGFSASSFNAQFFQSEVFVDWRLPWSWTWADDWHLEPKLDLSAGWIRGRADEGFVGTVGPSLHLRRKSIPLRLDLGVSPTYLSRDEFGETNFGVPFQLTSHAGLLLELGSHVVLGYRLQHMSNARLSPHNPGLNLHSFALGYRF